VGAYKGLLWVLWRAYGWISVFVSSQITGIKKASIQKDSVFFGKKYTETLLTSEVY
jgi:hypothetical protein